MNTPTQPRITQATTRRDFLKTSTVAGGGVLLASLDIARFAHAAGNDVIKIALVGCGGRGTNAASMALQNAAHANVKLVAMADMFADHIEAKLDILNKRCAAQIDVPPERRFVGFDACQKAIDCGVDMVLLCTPPGFRPMQFEAAVKAGKHVFMEKPVAVDAPGYRRVKAVNEEAKKKNLMVAVGHHLRHGATHREVVKQIHDGLIGDLTYTRAYFNTSGIWNRERKPGMTEMEYQVLNWYHFVGLSGDHLVEQHVHGVDVCNWLAKDHPPVEAVGMGGRQVRFSKGIGELFDHFALQFTYAKGLRSFSECRHMPACWANCAHHAHGTKGFVNFDFADNATICLEGQEEKRVKHTGAEAHQAEMDDLFAALLAGKPYNEADVSADSTMTAILGRMAAYSGKLVKWDEAIASQLDLMPDRFALDAEPKSKPGPDGIYPCATPGVTKAL